MIILLVAIFVLCVISVVACWLAGKFMKPQPPENTEDRVWFW